MPSQSFPVHMGPKVDLTISWEPQLSPQIEGALRNANERLARDYRAMFEAYPEVMADLWIAVEKSDLLVVSYNDWTTFLMLGTILLNAFTVIDESCSLQKIRIEIAVAPDPQVLT
jgi:hypothetical protein